MALNQPEQIKALFETHAAALVLYARQWAGARADAEDAVQEGFLRYWNSRGVATHSVAYLYRCVRSCALDLRRSTRRRSDREARVTATEPFFDAHLLDQETRESVEAAIAALPPEQAEVVVMKIWGGLTFPEIGHAADISPNTAAARYRYGIEAMRKALAHEVEP